MYTAKAFYIRNFNFDENTLFLIVVKNVVYMVKNNEIRVKTFFCFKIVFMFHIIQFMTTYTFKFQLS